MTQHETHTTQIPLRWGDFDRFGHVTNAAYIELAQEARVIWANDSFLAAGHDIPAVFVRKVEVDFLRPVLPSNKAVEVETAVNSIGSTSFVTRQDIYDVEHHLCATVTATQVAVDLQTARPREINEEERHVLTQIAQSAGS
ncbi:MAG: thioesterase family protein [Corynebacterium sp.]|nr:thioesterase family protein [Corynebacterium sp.]